jgi:hypothetical protein
LSELLESFRKNYLKMKTLKADEPSKRNTINSPKVLGLARKMNNSPKVFGERLRQTFGEF